MIHFLNEQEKQLFLQIVERNDRVYDEQVCMPTQWRGENGYHSRIVNRTVHSTVHSFEYALDLMCRGRNEDFARAEQILNAVIPLQDTDPSHDTYGIWPYFLEEPLTEMNPPDWNWADFCGKKILQMLLEFKPQISEDLIPVMEESLLHACHSIQRRDMGPGYTNISIMGAYVTLVSGEYFGREDLISYAKNRLKTLHRFNMDHGAFQEYNSPSYTWIVINDLAAMLAYIKDEESRALVEDLNDLAWGCLAGHYHYRTKQWAGPHSRFYAMLEDDSLLMQIQKALNYRILLVPLDKPGLSDSLSNCFFAVRSSCPEKYIPYFTQESGERMEYVRYLEEEDPREDEIAASYLSPAYTLGTFYKSTFWNQRRSHISYFGTEKAPIYCDLKCLHDGYDYSSGQIVTAQKNGKALSIIGFATDGGDTHPSLDPVKGASIEAEDLRLRFEIGGAVDHVQVRREDDCTFAVCMNGQAVGIRIPYAVFGEEEVKLELTSQIGHINETGDHKTVSDVIGIDVVLYHGVRKAIDFCALQECCAVVGFEILEQGETMEEIAWSVSGDVLEASMGGLKAEAMKRADTQSGFKKTARAYVDGVEYTEPYGCQNIIKN